MSSTVDEKLRKQNDCGCCQGVSSQTPAQVYNRPGLKTIAYRAGNYEQFKETMLARISASELSTLGLRTRDSDDFSIALLDSWAEVTDVLTFYQERIANESYLRTATERRSLLELARTIGYELSPGVAANAYLAFEIDDTPGSPAIVNIEKGIKVQSTPGPGEQPHTFETVESIEARPEWNAMRPKMSESFLPEGDDDCLYVKGISTNLKQGDYLLIIINQKSWELRKISSIEKDMEADRIQVIMASVSAKITGTYELFDQWPKVYVLRLKASVFGYNALEWKALPVSLRIGEWNPKEYDIWKSPDKQKNAFKDGVYASQENEWAHASFKKGVNNQIDLDSVYDSILPNGWIVLRNNTNGKTELYKVTNVVEGTKSKFGLSAKTSCLTISGENIENFSPKDTIVYAQSEELTLAEKPLKDPIQGNELTLDRSVVGLKPKQKVVLSGKRMHAKITKVADPDKNPLILVSTEDPNRKEVLKQGDELILLERPLDIKGRPEVKKWHLLSKNGLNGFVEANWKIDLIELKSDTNLAMAILSTFKTPKLLPKAEAFLATTISGAIKPSTPKPLSLKPDPLKNLGSIITPRYEIELVPSASEDEPVSELALIQDVFEADRKLILTQPGTKSTDYVLKNIYDRATVTISANVALATHGETASEILGSGDASLPNQRFVLSKSPLTYISAATPSGSETTLQVRVNDILWKEVPTLYGCSPQDRVYVTRLDDDGRTTVQFGDGHMGTRLPTGQQNIRALYRKGIGLGGLTKAGQINMLMTRPLGVKGAVNPLPSSGAQDRENLADARKNAPLTVLTLGRIVSLQDYEDFARSFAGIAKALATWTWDGKRTGVLVTVAGPEGKIIPEDSVTYENLLSAMRKAGDPYVSIALKSCHLVTFHIRASINIEPEYLPERVFLAVEQKLRAYFSFEMRQFGQAVFRSDIYAAIQGVPGVKAVNIEALYKTGTSADSNSVLKAVMPLPGDKIPDGAELLILDPEPLDLKVML